MDDWVQLAIQNNLDWYQEECAAHGVKNTRSTTTWHTLEKMPPFHSNLIHDGDELPADIVAALDRSVPPGWGIKEPRGVLDLTDQGFDLLFEAKWFVREPHALTKPAASTPAGGARWVQSDAEFADWIDSWGETPDDEVVFRTRFWNAPRVHFLQTAENDGGLACNISPACVGITNPWGDPLAINRCIRAIIERFPTYAIVGYDHMPNIDALADLNFYSTGPLAIWLRSPQ
ncbi:MAG: hypothetical protein GKR90_09060 [Pseudomonadales bacterium]|nr:hypothetical protein [Pseudomonadales bacterium]